MRRLLHRALLRGNPRSMTTTLGRHSPATVIGMALPCRHPPVAAAGGVSVSARQRRVSSTSPKPDPLISIPITQLIDQTHVLLEQESIDDCDLIAVMTDWLHHHTATPDTAASQMQLLLEHWLGTCTYYRTSEPFFLLLQQLAKMGEGQRAALVVDTWLGKLGGHLSLAPTLRAFHCALGGHARSAKVSVDAMLDIVAFLERTDMGPTVETYSHLVVAMERDSDHTHKWTDQMLSAIQQMDSKWNDSSSEQTYHYVRGYSRAMAWALKKKQWKLGREWYAKILLQVLQRPRLVHSTVPYEFPDNKERVEKLVGNLTRDYLSILFRLQEYEQTPKRQDPRMDEALVVLYTLTSLEMDHLPWANHYTSIIEMWSRTHRPGLWEFLKPVQQERLAQGKPNPIAWYSMTLLYLQKRKQPKDSEDLLHHVMELHNTDQLRGATDLELTRCWNHVLAAVPPVRVPALWTKFQAAEILPNYMTYNHVLWGLAHIASFRSAQDAQQVLSEMTDRGYPPQASHYGAVISAWTASHATDAAHRADALLQELEEKYFHTQQEWDEPRIDLYTNIIGAYGRSKTPLMAIEVFHRMKNHVEVDVVAYGALIHALGRAKTAEAAERTEEIVAEMEHAATFQNKTHLRPNSHIYTSCINAWALSKAPDAPQRAERLVGLLEDSYAATGRNDLQPDSVVYGTLVDVWARSTHPDAGKKAETWLRRFQDMGGTMNRVMYTNVIAAWWRSKADQPEQAIALLEEMKDEFANGNVDAAPDNRAYTTVIQTMAASSRPDKALLAWTLMEEMSKGYQAGNELLKPSVYPFTAVLNACAYTRGDANAADAVRVTLLVLNEMQVLGVAPNHVTYRTALNVFVSRNAKKRADHKEQEREQMIKVIFHRCCQDGQVHPDIVELLRRHHPKVYDRIPKDRSTGNVQVPLEWTINVKE
jgi:hypothetical protein